MINKILIIDDALINMTFLEMLFLKHEVTVSKAMQASEVEAIIETESFDVSLLDYHMPDVNGATLLKKLDKNNSLHKLGQIYMLTADVDFNPAKAGIGDFLKDCMRKPIDVNRLEQALFPDTISEEKN